MVEVRDLSSNVPVVVAVVAVAPSEAEADATTSFRHENQYGLFATKAYAEGDVVLTESPLVALSSPSYAPSAASASGRRNDDDDDAPPLRSQFAPSFLIRGGRACSGGGGGDDDERRTSSVVPGELLLPPDEAIDDARSGGKVRGMILALAGYAARPPSEEAMSTLLELHHPSPTSTSSDDDDGDGKEIIRDAIALARSAIRCGRKMAATGSALGALLLRRGGDDEEEKNHDDDDDELLLARILLVYSCNAFEGGRIYRTLSRVNHSCDPNAVVVVGGGGGITGGADDDDDDVSVLKAACDIAPGEEITISYLGKYLFASYPIRQRLLRAEKHFVCRCARCESRSVVGASGGGDSASRVPCPICHPRAGRYLDDDVMFDDDDRDGGGNGFEVRYAVPSNGLTPEERPLYCPACKGTTDVDGRGSTRKKKEGTAVKYMCVAEDKVFDRLHNSYHDARKGGGENKSKVATTGGDDDDDDDDDDAEEEAEQEIDRQYLQMATSVCGSRHWATIFLNLSSIEDSLASFHSTLLALGGRDPADGNGNAEKTLEGLFAEIAEVADGIERAFKFASSLDLKLDPAHWLFDYALGLARVLVGLGDVKSMKYGSRWIGRVEKYAERFENDGMRKVVVALRDAWKRETKDPNHVENSGSDKHCGGPDAKEDSKRRKIG